MTQPLAPLPATPGLAERFAAILMAVAGKVAARVRQRRTDCIGVLIPAAIAGFITAWLLRRRTRIRDLIGRIEAGTQRPPRPYQARPYQPGVAKPAAARPWRASPPVSMPGSLAWLCALAQEVRGDGVALGTLVAEPRLQAMVLDHPQLARLLRPVLLMLGETPPDWFPRPARRVRVRRRRGAASHAASSISPTSEEGVCPAPVDPDPGYDLACLLAQLRAQALDDHVYATRIRRDGDIEPPRIPVPLPDPRHRRPPAPPPPDPPPPRPRREAGWRPLSAEVALSRRMQPG